MRLTIIPIDGAVYKDGSSYSHLKWQGTPLDIHALQWFDTNTGWVEFNNGNPNVEITLLPSWADNALAAWEAANVPVPPPAPTPTEIQKANFDTAQLLLTESDFTQLPDVNLVNKDEWAIYRNLVRAVAVEPPSTPYNFPPQPALVWA